MRLYLADRPRRIRAKWLFLGALLALSLLAVWLHPAAAQPRDALDWRDAPNALGLELSARTAPSTATFVWHLAPGAERVACRLDADGDGTFDHEVFDCAGQKALTHRYEASGLYFATLVAASADGRAGIARVELAVAAE